MTAARGAIETVVVAGGGIVGWSAAAALKRRLPALRVTLIASPPPPEALAERIASTLPSILGFHADLGLTEEDTVVRARSGLRLGTEFVGWTAGRPAYVHAYAPHGEPFGTASFHHQWVRLARDGRAAPFDAHSPAVALARAGRFAPGEAPVEYGLTLDLPRYGQMMRAFARHLGVEERPGSIAGVRVRESDGFIEAVRLEGGGEVDGHLFVDATGPAAALRSALDGRFEDWSRWLPCDRVRLGESPPRPGPPLLDRVEALAAGWQWRSPSPVRTSHGVAYGSRHCTDAETEGLLRAAGAEAVAPAIALRQGRRPEPWLRNCVAIGDSAVAVEPLEWTNLHLAHSAIDRLVAMLPGRDCAPVELAEHNRQAEAEADRVRDFLAVHYLAADRPEPFWAAAAAAPPPASLAHTLALFHERGRLPFHEEETFSRDSWLAVLLGQGVIPRRTDPLTDALSRDEAAGAMERIRASFATMAPALPTHGDYLANLSRQVRR
ncbi:MAG TPA: tryptophan halogenase family protein [Allosphingosinicella sp.]